MMGETEVGPLPCGGAKAGGRGGGSPAITRVFLASLAAGLCGAGTHEASAQVQRVLGLDVSAWQGSISQTKWNNIHTVETRDFVIIRSSRGGTTGYYNQNDPNNTSGNNTLSQRYDDPYYIQNINRATAAGMFAGSYHFSRPDIIETTLNSGGIRNSGTDEANHFIQMAGPWMRPGYLVPMHDLEAGDGIRTDNEMAQFCLDFSTRIYQVMGIRPGIYLNGNYAAYVLGTASSSLRNLLAQPPALLPSVVSPAYPVLWSARWPNQSDPNSIDVQNGEPKDSYTAIYGPWDDYGTVHPWKFWQYASTAHLASYSTTANLDVDVARGGIEFLKDQLVPAVWMTDASGNWGTLLNWNSGQTPLQPVPGPGQVTPAATGPLPTPRLPGAAGSGVTSGPNDTVILERPNANVTVTLSSGSYNIRKLYMREALSITGGSLNINYVPSSDSTPISAQFSGSVTLSGSGSISVHTLQVDPACSFNLAGGAVTFDTINLMPHSSTPAKILVLGSVSFNPRSNAAAEISNGSGSGSSGLLDLAGGMRVLTVSDGAADVDLAANVPLTNGGLSKSGAGTLLLNSANTYTGGTIVSAGRLLVNNTTNSGTGTGAVTVDGGTLAGNGTISGTVTLNAAGTIAPGTGSALGLLTLNTAPVLHGTNAMRVNKGGAPLADKLVLTSGTLNYGGTLAVVNIGAALTGGEVFTLFSAPGYSGAFDAAILPSLSSTLNWDLGSLALNGTIRVNRQPVANGITVTNTPGAVLEIPIVSLLGAAADADADPLSLAGFDPVTTNGMALSGDGTNLYYFDSANVADQFSYTISDGHGGTALALAQILPGLAVAPSITVQPQSQTNLPGTDASFSVVAAGTAPLEYQWQWNGTNIPGASNSSYMRQQVQSSDEGSYSVVISNVAGVTNSSPALLTVIQPVPAHIDFYTMLPSGQFYFQASGAPGHYAIDATTNFVAWDELTNLITTTESFDYTAEETNGVYRFYRVRLMQ